jgi:hypothetical protein
VWPLYRLYLDLLHLNPETLLKSVEAWPLAVAMRGETESTEWLFPIVETLHVVALSIVFGSIAMLDLRLLGLSSNRTAVSRLTREVLPWTWSAWIAAAIFGSLMFMAKADVYAENLEFRLKFICMALAAVNMLVFHLGAFRNVASWDTQRPPLSARLAGGLSLTLWTGVVFFGRWIGFTT